MKTPMMSQGRRARLRDGGKTVWEGSERVLMNREQVAHPVLRAMRLGRLEVHPARLLRIHPLPGRRLHPSPSSWPTVSRSVQGSVKACSVANAAIRVLKRRITRAGAHVPHMICTGRSMRCEPLSARTTLTRQIKRFWTASTPSKLPGGRIVPGFKGRRRTPPPTSFVASWRSSMSRRGTLR